MQYTIQVPFNFNILNATVDAAYETIFIDLALEFDRRITIATGGTVLSKDPSMQDILANVLYDTCVSTWQEILHHASTRSWTYYNNYGSQNKRFKNYIYFSAHGTKNVKVNLNIIVPPPQTGPYSLQDIKDFKW